jgi:uncharacterized surface protein with fasciclin (FAS1) repeats
MRTETAEGPRRTGALAVAAIAAVVALTAAGCGSSGTSGSGAAGAGATHHPMAEAATIGSDCGMIPATGMGSVHGMSMDPVVTAATHNPLLTSFAADAKAAGLTSDLNSMHAITVFAPANSAFSSLSSHDMAMMHSASELATVLKYHVVDGRVTPAELTSGMTVKTLQGGSLKLSKMGSVYEVNNADVLCGNIHAANATIYVINKVLLPMHHSM